MHILQTSINNAYKTSINNAYTTIINNPNKVPVFTGAYLCANNQYLAGLSAAGTLLLGIENWFKINGDEKGARIVEQATLKLARHEAETA